MSILDDIYNLPHLPKQRKTFIHCPQCDTVNMCIQQYLNGEVTSDEAMRIISVNTHLHITEIIEG